MANTVAIRGKVAELNGWTDLSINLDACGLLEGNNCGRRNTVPFYDLSLDAIEESFNDNKLTYTLQKGIKKNSGDVGYVASHPSVADTFSNTAAKALCYLFIHLMEVEG